MKHFCHKICLVVLACFSYLSASAYDFEADGLYFTITSLKDLTVSVDGAVNKDTDKIVIPQTVVYKGRTLTVTSVGDKAFFGASFYSASIIRKTKRFAIPERAVYFLKTKRTAGGTPPPQNIFDRLTPVFT